MRPLPEVQGRICGFLAGNAEGEQEGGGKESRGFFFSLSVSTSLGHAEVFVGRSLPSRQVFVK